MVHGLLRLTGLGARALAAPGAVALALGAAAPLPASADESRPGLTPCRLEGVAHGALCGSVRRALDPAAPGGPVIEVHFAVLPALARNRKPDPVFFFAGGPGQSALELAGTVSRLLARLGTRRDLVLIDQRGTGRSAPLRCAELPPNTALAETLEPARQMQRYAECLQQLQALPHGDLRHYTTWVAVQDADAVRQALGAERINLVGGSYGTRAVLEYQRQFPQATRRAVIDGVAPPDMVLPASISADSQAALDRVFAACAGEAACAARFPTLRSDWKAMLNSLPREFTVAHPLTGVIERLTLGRDALLSLVRSSLYLPALASALPAALHEAARGRLEPLAALATAMAGGGRRSGQLYEGMHFAVVCSEDLPRLAASDETPGADFGPGFAQQYRRVCSGWPQGAVPADFYKLPRARHATLVLSGGADPATPPRHGLRVAQALGEMARHQVVAQAGHGVMSLPCMRDVLYRFIDADTDAEALQVDTACAARVPQPPAYLPPRGASGPAP
jgi:pimeloyl-ACP methyl ester carboxylesterase